MNSYLHAIATSVPEHVYTQDAACACMHRWMNDERLQRIVTRLYKNSGIEKRHSVLPDFKESAIPLLFKEDEDGRLSEPLTGDRNRVFEGTYPGVTHDAITNLFASQARFNPADVTHVITVSCTGFSNPGPDLYIKDVFNLSPSVERYHIGFMGCYAAFPALRMADQFCRANPHAVVLIVCIELCTLHLQVKPTEDSLLANALFSDGVAAALVSAEVPDHKRRTFMLDAFTSRQLSEGREAMAWTVGNHGFDMTLSGAVPRLLKEHSGRIVDEMLQECEVSTDMIGGWAIHPGGLAILRAIEHGLALDSTALRASYDVMRDYGNMSSATIFFVLKKFLEESNTPEGTRVACAAFGPGLTVEFGLLKAVGASPVHGLESEMSRDEKREV